MTARLLIVEDDPALSQMLCMHFEDEGFAADAAMDCAEALERVEETDYDLLLLDQQLPDGTGLDLLFSLLERNADLLVVMMTGRHDLELAIEAIKRGAADFVHKPVAADDLRGIVDRLLARRRLAREAQVTTREHESDQTDRDLIGRSAAMLAVSKEIALSACSDATVLITGESGTGKEVVARLLHRHSGRTGPFVAVNCAAIVDTLLESELFGHEKGAFTGAQGRKLGKFELARAGTLFLDEVGELKPGLQAKLLRALQERAFERVGGTQSITTDARLIAATNRDLTAEAAAGRFREDLVYRLNVVHICMPPLRERTDDIPLLATHLLKRIAERFDKGSLTLADATLQRLSAYDWPGNVRELENLLTQAAVRVRTGLITPDLIALPAPAAQDSEPAAAVGEDANGPDLRTLDEVEAAHVQQVLNHTGGHKGRTSQILGISRPALDRKIEKFNLRMPAPSKRLR